MIIGVGNDIVNLRRLEKMLKRYPQRLPAKILTQEEIAQSPDCSGVMFPINYLGGRWAAKEALGKALGCGLSSPLTWRQMSVLKNEAGKPFFSFAAAARRYVERRGVQHCHLSISHDGDYAAAVVIVEGGA